MSKGFFVSIIILAFMLGSFGCTKKEPQEIKIGAILPLTGDGAKYGEEAKNGIELALSEINGAGGINGKEIKVVYEDDQGTSPGAINALNKLITSEKTPVVLGPMFSSTALAVAPLGEKNRIVIFSISASTPQLTMAGDYFFRNWPSDIYEGSEMARVARNQLKLANISILTVNLDYGVGLTNVFKKVFELSGGKVLTIESYDQGAADFRTQLSKIKSLNPEGVYLPGYYAEIGIILRQAKEMGIKTQFLSAVGFDNPTVLEIAGTAAEGVIFARPYYDPEGHDPAVKSFVQNFKGQYGVLPGIYAAHAYDGLRILARVTASGGYSAEGIKKALYSMRNFPGVTGNTSFDANGDVVKPIQIMEVRKGDFTNYQPRQ